jgi:putative transcriptional regulator
VRCCGLVFLNGGLIALGEELANRLRAQRDAKGWTQADVAERIGVSRKTINTIENGIFTPSTVIALKLARAFKLRVEDLFSLRE